MSLPEVIQHQDFLLTLNTNEESIIKDALPGVDVYPLFLDPENGTWVIRAKFKPGVTLPKHFHTGVVHFYTLGGAWHYIEYPDQLQTAGSYLYEPGGSIHTFHCPENSGGADGFMVITGANINFDEQGNSSTSWTQAGLSKLLLQQQKHKASPLATSNRVRLLA